MATLYRCKAPTDRLCACGKVARRLRRSEIDFDEVRVATRRRDRPEIEALTSQLEVPVLVLGEEVVHDSKRIVEHVDFVTARGEAGGAANAGDAGERA